MIEPRLTRIQSTYRISGGSRFEILVPSARILLSAGGVSCNRVSRHRFHHGSSAIEPGNLLVHAAMSEASLLCDNPVDLARLRPNRRWRYATNNV